MSVAASASSPRAWMMNSADPPPSASSFDEAAFDEASFTAFYQSTASGLWRYLARVGGDPTLADDLVQESFLRVLRRPPESADRAVRRAYLYRVASNLLRDRWRSAERWRRRADEVARHDLARRPPAGDGVLRADLQSHFGELPPRQRAMLWLAYVEGWQHREIARALGLRATSVRVMLLRARRKLAARLESAGYRPEDER